MARWCWLTSAIILATSCGTRSTVVPRRPPDRSKWSVASAPPPSSRVVAPSAVERLTRGMDAHFEGRPGRRIHIQLDRPIYQPGDTIWVKTWHLRSRDLSGEHGNQELHYQLISPRGTVVVDHLVRESVGLATNDVAIPPGIEGGEYRLRVVTLDRHQAERSLMISSYEPPRIKKKLEFLRKAYGPGDEVTATIEVRCPTGEGLGNHPLTAVVRLDGQPMPRFKLGTDGRGDGLVRFTLPQQIEAGDGLLTVMVEDGGVTESITRRIPILLKQVRIALFPEGGNLVAGLQTRVYFGAVNAQGKPADIEGRVVDDRGRVVARFRSYFHGLGRMDLTPRADRRYHAEVTRPTGIDARFELPPVRAAGCVLTVYDDPDSTLEAIVAGVRCASARRAVVAAVLRERLLDVVAVQVPDGGAAVVHLSSTDGRLNRAQVLSDGGGSGNTGRCRISSRSG